MDFAYEDTPLPSEEGQTISQPYIVAHRAAARTLTPRDRVLEIGAGSGYAAAVLSRVAAEVYTIERHEGEDLFNYVTSVFGDDVLMYASDYPHSECQFPNSVDNILTWKSLGADRQRKLLWDNAARFYKQG